MATPGSLCWSVPLQHLCGVLSVHGAIAVVVVYDGRPGVRKESVSVASLQRVANPLSQSQHLALPGSQVLVTGKNGVTRRGRVVEDEDYDPNDDGTKKKKPKPKRAPRPRDPMAWFKPDVDESGDDAPPEVEVLDFPQRHYRAKYADYVPDRRQLRGKPKPRPRFDYEDDPDFDLPEDRSKSPNPEVVDEASVPLNPPRKQLHFDPNPLRKRTVTVVFVPMLADRPEPRAGKTLEEPRPSMAPGSYDSEEPDFDMEPDIELPEVSSSEEEEEEPKRKAGPRISITEPDSSSSDDEPPVAPGMRWVTKAVPVEQVVPLFEDAGDAYFVALARVLSVRDLASLIRALPRRLSNALTTDAVWLPRLWSDYGAALALMYTVDGAVCTPMQRALDKMASDDAHRGRRYAKRLYELLTKYKTAPLIEEPVGVDVAWQCGVTVYGLRGGSFLYATSSGESLRDAVRDKYAPNALDAFSATLGTRIVQLDVLAHDYGGFVALCGMADHSIALCYVSGDTRWMVRLAFPASRDVMMVAMTRTHIAVAMESVGTKFFARNRQCTSVGSVRDVYARAPFDANTFTAVDRERRVCRVHVTGKIVRTGHVRTDNVFVTWSRYEPFAYRGKRFSLVVEPNDGTLAAYAGGARYAFASPMVIVSTPIAIACSHCAAETSTPLHACSHCEGSAFCSDECGEGHLNTVH